MVGGTKHENLGPTVNVNRKSKIGVLIPSHQRKKKKGGGKKTTPAKKSKTGTKGSRTQESYSNGIS